MWSFLFCSARSSIGHSPEGTALRLHGSHDGGPPPFPTPPITRNVATPPLAAPPYAAARTLPPPPLISPSIDALNGC